MIRPNLNGASAPPCFYFPACQRRAALEKNGKALCRDCAARARGREYPLRAPSREPLYLIDREAAEAFGMIERHPGVRLRRRVPRKTHLM